ncbi:Pilin-like competence factor ComP [Saliniradius amylolyticus]|uniref:Pilin-like competence factor ComP n=1 Tax=Saliniradius amylolyticus TaxID=2183582 RepID=A0A2S2DZL2_9ALTE|nr:prepilin-type N-terminal cleavage/methylation domain-containing protein [Saliniradius amylolyticus]AWL10789.1 Pilin-like competence factor ComP [Saliniradius amylolyticus]
MQQQRGFTLIELVIVIVILGILAVTAAPRFIDLTDEARVSSVTGVKGSIQSAANIIYSQAAVDSSLSGDATVNGINTVNGYPTATAAGIILASQLDSAANESANVTSEFLHAITAESADEAGDGEIALTLSSVLAQGDQAAIEATNCYVKYVETDSSDTPPTVTSDTSGC